MEKFTPTFERFSFNENKCWSYTNIKLSNRYWIFYNTNSDTGKEWYTIEVEFWYNNPILTKKILVRWIKTLEDAMKISESITTPTSQIDLNKDHFLLPKEMRWL